MAWALSDPTRDRSRLRLGFTHPLSINVDEFSILVDHPVRTQSMINWIDHLLRLLVGSFAWRFTEQIKWPQVFPLLLWLLLLLALVLGQGIF